jgi:hypothetical protein
MKGIYGTLLFGNLLARFLQTFGHAGAGFDWLTLRAFFMEGHNTEGGARRDSQNIFALSYRRSEVLPLRSPLYLSRLLSATNHPADRSAAKNALKD